MSIQYSFSRLEAKEAKICDDNCEAGNICSLVVGMTATSGDYSAYIDGVTGCLNYSKEDFSGVIGQIANDFAAAQNFKETLSNQIFSKASKPINATNFVAPPVTVN